MEGIKRRERTLIILRILIMGALAGVANGLLGAGGGILVVFGLSGLMKEYEARDLYASALCVMLPVSVVSCIRYASGGNLSTEGFDVYVLPAILGGLLGGLLLGRLKGAFLKKLFGGLVIYSVILLMLK